MGKNTGTSLTEVLVSLLLISTILLMLLKQQWQSAQWTNQLMLQYDGLIFLDNQSERQLNHKPVLNPPQPFKLQQKQHNDKIDFDLYWTSPRKNGADCCHLIRAGLPR